MSAGWTISANTKNNAVAAMIPNRTGHMNRAKNSLASAPAAKIFTRSIKVLASNRHRPSVKKSSLSCAINPSIAWAGPPRQAMVDRVRRVTIGGLVTALAVTQVAPAAWAAPTSATLRTMGAASEQVKAQVKAGLEEGDRQPPATPATQEPRPKVLPKPALKRLTLPPLQSAAPATTTPPPIISDRPPVQPPTPQAGLEEPVELRSDWTVVVTQAIHLTGEQTLRLPNDGKLAANGGVIHLEPGASIGPDGQFTAGPGQTISVHGTTKIGSNTRVFGQVAIRAQNAIGHNVVVKGSAALPTILGVGTQISDSSIIEPGVVLLPRLNEDKDAAGNTELAMIPTTVQRAHIFGPNVIWGSAVGESAYIRPRNILINASVDDFPSMTRSYLHLATYAHKGVGARTVLLGLQPPADIQPLTPAYYAWLKAYHAAALFGTIEQVIDHPVQGAGPNIHPHLEVRLRHQGQGLTTRMRRSNGGAGYVNSDFFQTGDGWKSYFVGMGGIHFGVGAGSKVPGYGAPDAVVQSRAETTLMDAAAAATLVLPQAVDPAARVALTQLLQLAAQHGWFGEVASGIPQLAGPVRPGYLAGERGVRMSKAGAQILQVHLGVVETLATLAAVHAIGYALVSDDDQRLAQRMAVMILADDVKEALGFVPKLRELSSLNSTAFAEDVARVQGIVDEAKKAVGLEQLEPVLKRFEPQMREWFEGERPVVLICDTPKMDEDFIVNSGEHSTQKVAQVLKRAGVSARDLEAVLNTVEQQMGLPPAQRRIGFAAVINIPTAVYRMAALKKSPVEAVRGARVRLHGTDGRRALGVAEGEVFKMLNSGRISPTHMAEHAYATAEWSIARKLIARGAKIVLAYDPRADATVETENGSIIPPMAFVNAAIRGNRLAGLQVLDAGTISVWGVPVYMVSSGAAMGAMVTASHNPYMYQGIKYFVGPALKLFPEDDYEVTAYIYRVRARGLPADGGATLEPIDARAEAANAVRDAMASSDNTWASRRDFLKNTIVMVDAARGSGSGRAKDPDRPDPWDPDEFGALARAFADYGATVGEVGKNLGYGNVNDGCGVGAFEGTGLTRVTRDHLRPESKPTLSRHELFAAMFAAADRWREDLGAGTKRLVGVLSDADGDRLYLLVYNPVEDAIYLLSGDETAFIQGTYLLQKSPWRAALQDAVFAGTVERDHNVGQAALGLGFKVRYTGVGDKWILLQAVNAWFEAAIRILRESPRGSFIATELADLSEILASLGGENMQSARAIELLKALNELAEQIDVDLGKALSAPGAIKFGIADEESGHNIVFLLTTTPDGHTIEIPVGSAGISALRTLWVFQELFPLPNTIYRTLHNQKNGTPNIVDFYGFTKEPFLRGHKRTRYAYYVDKTRLTPGSRQWDGLRRVMERGVRRALGQAFSVEESPRADEPDMIYFTIKAPSGREIGAVFVRNSGTENKTSVYVRGPVEFSGETKFTKKLDRLADLVEIAANYALGDRDSPAYQVRQEIEKAQRVAGEDRAIALEQARAIATRVREPDHMSEKALTKWWEKRFLKEMVDSARIFEINGSTIRLVPRPALQTGDRNWAQKQIDAMTGGLEEIAPAETFEVPSVAASAVGLEKSERPADLVRKVRDFFATATVPEEFQPGMGLVVDLAAGYESDALAALLLPKGSIVVVGTDALLKAEQLAGRTAIEQGLTTVTTDRGPDGVPAALRAAVAHARGGGGKTVRVYSETDSGELRQILNDVADGSVEFNGGLTVEQILRRLRPDDLTTVKGFLALLGRAGQEWRSLREYL